MSLKDRIIAEKLPQLAVIMDVGVGQAKRHGQDLWSPLGVNAVGK